MARIVPRISSVSAVCLVRTGALCSAAGELRRPTHRGFGTLSTRRYCRRWIVAPGEPGSDVPPVGRSLFDYLVTDNSGPEPVYRVPFPFTALREGLERQLRKNANGSSGIRQVLIPLGRSLQRTAAAPDFFRYPRVVLAVDGEPQAQPHESGVFMKDRLYLGYLEKPGVLEVISYNESAGRFEFQIVSDYREGGKANVVYANRAVCTACHQNLTPIFARPLWGRPMPTPG